MSILFKITPEDRTYGLIVGETGYIITENDLCHSIYKFNECAELINRLDEDYRPEYQEYSLVELNDMAEPIEWKDFVLYWGIKDCICQNYKLLQQSLEQIGVYTTLPKWGER